MESVRLFTHFWATHMLQLDLENPTLVLKLSGIFCQPWNTELRDEALDPENIRRLKSTFVNIPVVAGSDGESSEERSIELFGFGQLQA